MDETLNVELTAEVGCLAQRLRCIEKLLIIKKNQQYINNDDLTIINNDDDDINLIQIENIIINIYELNRKNNHNYCAQKYTSNMNLETINVTQSSQQQQQQQQQQSTEQQQQTQQQQQQINNEPIINLDNNLIKIKNNNSSKLCECSNKVNNLTTKCEKKLLVCNNIDYNNEQIATISQQQQQQQQQDNTTNQLLLYNNDRKITDNDVKLLVNELKRKIEYTEKMNWLCLSQRPLGQLNRKSSLPNHTEVKKRFIELCNQTLSNEIKSALRLPSFDSYNWEDADVLHLIETMFLELGLVDKFHISTIILREWLYEVYKHYNAVPFHNFRHCFCVAQMMYAISWQTDLVNRLGEFEVLILLISCICHDLDHPGYNNIYQINARTELALRYNDISPLENHHCSIAFRLFEHPDCNIFKNFSKETYKEAREGIIRCILATDMARHNEILNQFKEVIHIFDYTNKAHTNLLCMILIKVADISNEARPMDIAEPWLDRLLQEFFAQSALEKSEGLPVTPFMDPDKVSKPGSQVRFIGLVLLPLFEALGELLPELIDFIIVPVRVALDYYKRLNDAQTKTRKSIVEIENSSESESPQLPRSLSGISVRSRKSIPSQKSTSKTSVEEQVCVAAELHDLPEGSESGDSETATEVEVAEKTSKFKVDTEGSNRNKLMDSRKGSREKRQSICGDYYTSSPGRLVRGSHGNIHTHLTNHRSQFGANRAVSLDQCGTNNINRRMSDGLSNVTSDSTVFYNHFHHHHHHHHHLQNQQINLHNNQCSNNIDMDETIEQKQQQQQPPTADTKLTKDCENMNLNSYLDNNKLQSQQQMGQTQLQQQQQQQETIKLQNSNNGAKTLFSRLRQLTGRFSFNFDKEPKRINNSNCSNQEQQQGGTTGIIQQPPHSSHSQQQQFKNNNAEQNKLTDYCCNIQNSSTNNFKKVNHDLLLTNATIGTTTTTTNNTITTAATASTLRNRAFSLDIPINNKNHYSCSSSNDISRKSSSSHNDDNQQQQLHQQHQQLQQLQQYDDTNSNNTITTNNDNNIIKIKNYDDCIDDISCNI